jgi:hypothetical protein
MVIDKVISWIGFCVSGEVRFITYVCFCLLSFEVEIPIEKMKHLHGKVTNIINRIAVVCSNTLQ